MRYFLFSASLINYLQLCRSTLLELVWGGGLSDFREKYVS